MFVASATAATVALLLVVSAAHADAAQLVHPGPTGRSHHFVLQPTAVPHPESDHHVVLAVSKSHRPATTPLRLAHAFLIPVLS